MGAEKPLSLAQLFALYHQRVARWAGHLGGPTIEVEDAVQEVFVVAHRRISELQTQAYPLAWLFRVTENVVRTQRRRARRQRKLLVQAANVQRQLDQGPSAVLPAQLVQRENEHRLYAALDRMRERHRRLFILFELEELSGEEIAELTGLRLPSLWVALHRARGAFVVALASIDREARRPGPFRSGGSR